MGLPSSSSLPSGHAATAFAAAAAVGSFHPRLRVPLYALAAVVALSRVYLGVHFWFDIAAGAALGHVDGERAPADAARRLLDLLPRSRRDCDSRARRCELAGDVGADAASAARDERDTPGEVVRSRHRARA